MDETHMVSLGGRSDDQENSSWKNQFFAESRAVWDATGKRFSPLQQALFDMVDEQDGRLHTIWQAMEGARVSFEQLGQIEQPDDIIAAINDGEEIDFASAMSDDVPRHRQQLESLFRQTRRKKKK